MAAANQVDVFAATLIKLNRQTVDQLVEIKNEMEGWANGIENACTKIGETTKAIEDACLRIATTVNQTNASLANLTKLLTDRLVPSAETLTRLLRNAEARSEETSDQILDVMKASEDRRREWRLVELCKSTGIVPRDALVRLNELVMSSHLRCSSSVEMLNRKTGMSDADQLVLSRMGSEMFGVEWTFAQISGVSDGHEITSTSLKETLDHLERIRMVTRVQVRGEGFWGSAVAKWVLLDDGRRWSLA